MAEDIEESPTSNELVTDTVRRRRGYRPLSVFTPSMFFPFDGETAKAMSLLDMDTADHPVMTPSRSPTTLQTRAYASGHHPGKSFLTVPTEPLSPTIDALSPTRQHESHSSQSEIKCSYSSLIFLPPPDPSQHPAWQEDPFRSTSDSPDLICTSTADEIRQISAESQTSRTSSFETCTTPSFGGSLPASNRTSESSETGSSNGRRRIYIPEYIRSPDPILGKKGFSARTEGSPLANRFREIVIPSSATSLPDLVEGDKKRTGSGSLRKLSDLFKSKLSGERSRSSASIVTEPFEEANSPFLEPRSILVREPQICLVC